MKKRILVLTLSLLLALNASACGTQSTSGNGTGQNAPDGSTVNNSGQNTPNSSGTATDSSGMNVPNSSGTATDSSGMNVPNSSGTGSSDLDMSGIFGIDDSSLSFSSLTDFYNSQYRPLLEDTLNEIFHELGLHIFITIEEPGTFIYNYQYTSPLSSIGFSHEDAATAIASNLQEAGYDVQAENIIKEFQSCGISLQVVRMNYLDADGSLVYSADFTENGDSTGLPDNSGLPDSSGTASGIYTDLQAWMDSSEDVALTVQSVNQSLASTGITFDLAVDGSILVYKYYLPAGFFADGLAEEDMTAAFDSMVDAGSASVDAILAMFMDKYGLTVDAVRFAYYSKDGTELYSRDVRP